MIDRTLLVLGAGLALIGAPALAQSANPQAATPAVPATPATPASDGESAVPATPATPAVPSAKADADAEVAVEAEVSAPAPEEKVVIGKFRKADKKPD